MTLLLKRTRELMIMLPEALQNAQDVNITDGVDMNAFINLDGSEHYMDLTQTLNENSFELISMACPIMIGAGVTIFIIALMVSKAGGIPREASAIAAVLVMGGTALSTHGVAIANNAAVEATGGAGLLGNASAYGADVM